MFVARTRWRLLAAILSFLTASLLVGVTAPAATAAGTASISGTVSAPAGTDMSQFIVNVRNAANGTTQAYTTVNTNGSFTITGLPADTYTVGLDGTSQFLAQTKTVTVSDGQSLTGVNFTMTYAAFITGQVTVPAGVNPQQILVSAYNAASSPTGQSASSMFLSADGSYQLSGLTAGSYKVRFEETGTFQNSTYVAPTLITQWYANQGSFNTSTPVTVAEGQTVSGINATMVVGATISGHVTGPASSTMPYVCLGAFPADSATAAVAAPMGSQATPPAVKPMAAVGSPCPQWWFNSVTSIGYAAADGSYTIAALPAGNYKIMALPTPWWNGSSQQPPTYVGQWYSNELLRSTSAATSVSVPQNVTGVDFALRPDITFTDVPVGAQFHDEITWLGSTGVSTGYPNGDGTNSYHPLSSVNRDAMAAFMYRLAGSPAYTAPATSPFTDITPSTQFYKEITWLNTTKISTGYPNGDGTYSFHPLSPVNRDAMAAFLYRFAGSPAFTAPATSPFTDVATNNPFYTQITWLAGTGISTGWTQPDGTKTFAPVTAVARDAMAAFMNRYQAMDNQK